MSHQPWDRHFYCHNTIISNWIDWQSTDPTLQPLQPTFRKFDHQLTSDVFNGLVDSANQDKKWRSHGLTRRPIPNATLLHHISNLLRTPHSFLIFLGLVALWLEIIRGPRGFRKKNVVRCRPFDLYTAPYPDSLPNRPLLWLQSRGHQETQLYFAEPRVDQGRSSGYPLLNNASSSYLNKKQVQPSQVQHTSYKYWVKQKSRGMSSLSTQYTLQYTL
jgi:hypothetical protein